MEFIVDRSFTKQGKQHLQANDKLYEGMELHKKTSGSPLNIEIIKQSHKIMMHKEKHQDGKDVLVGENKTSPACAGYHIFAPADLIERYMKDAISRFYETRKVDPIMAAANLFRNIINIHLFEDGNGRICCLILAHV